MMSALKKALALLQAEGDRVLCPPLPGACASDARAAGPELTLCRHVMTAAGASPAAASPAAAAAAASAAAATASPALRAQPPAGPELSAEELEQAVQARRSPPPFSLLHLPSTRAAVLMARRGGAGGPAEQQLGPCREAHRCALRRGRRMGEQLHASGSLAAPCRASIARCACSAEGRARRAPHSNGSNPTSARQVRTHARTHARTLPHAARASPLASHVRSALHSHRLCPVGSLLCSDAEGSSCAAFHRVLVWLRRRAQETLSSALLNALVRVVGNAPASSQRRLFRLRKFVLLLEVRRPLLHPCVAVPSPTLLTGVEPFIRRP
jgi:hypothetical protein